MSSALALATGCGALVVVVVVEEVPAALRIFFAWRLVHPRSETSSWLVRVMRRSPSTASLLKAGANWPSSSFSSHWVTSSTFKSFRGLVWSAMMVGRNGGNNI